MRNKVIAIVSALALSALTLAGCGDLPMPPGAAGGQGAGGAQGGWNLPGVGGSTGQPGQGGGRPSPTQAGGGDKSLQQMLDDGTAVQYNRAALTDTALGCEAVRSVMPAGWQVGGQVNWSGQSEGAPAVIDFSINSPDGNQRVGFVSAMTYSENTYNNVDGWDTVLLAPVKQYESADVYAADFMNQYVGVTGQVSQVNQPSGTDLQTLQAMQAAQQQAFSQNDDMWNQAWAQQGQMVKTQVTVSGAYVDMSFSTNGATYKATVMPIIMRAAGTITYSYNPGGILPTTNALWVVLGVTYYLAEQGKFDPKSDPARLFMSNLIINQQWTNATNAVSAQIAKQKMDQIMQNWKANEQALQAQAQQISQSSQQDYQSTIDARNGANSSVLAGWDNSISQKSYFEGSDGAPVLLDDTMTYTYNTGDGNFVQSDDVIPGLDPANNLGPMPPGG
ncbi:MAG: hypothetical protein FWD74_04710 [Actinomycetia bacterium]|nr:hypothetical protein [Actinomycetes bacterium]